MDFENSYNEIAIIPYIANPSYEHMIKGFILKNANGNSY